MVHHRGVHPAIRPLANRWLYALKPKSWPKLLVPAVLGQVIGFCTTGTLDLGGLAIGLGCTVLLLIYIVLLNDYGDMEVDTLKRSLFPEGCSPKTIPDGVLDETSVLLGGLGAGVMVVAVALCGELYVGRPGLMLAGALCVLPLMLYTFAPARLNYRGGGEFLEMVGVGLMLPGLNALAQGGSFASPLLLVLAPGLMLLALASAIASGLSDEVSDERGGKCTFVTEFGNSTARSTVENLVLGAALMWSVGARLHPDVVTPVLLTPAAVVLLLCWREMVKVSPHARTSAFIQLARYKLWLHRGIWGSGLVLAVMLLTMHVFRGAGL